MSDYTFMVEGDGRHVTYTCETVQLQEVLEHFQDFLRGAGFYFNGNLEFVDDSIGQEIVGGAIPGQQNQGLHSEHYYTKNRT
jgi:hypothetical protein